MELSPAIHRALDAARAAWPDVTLSDESFAAAMRLHLGERESGEGDRDAAPPPHAAGLYLATACAEGDPVARTRFEAAYFEEVSIVCARFPSLGVSVDDVAQRLREKLFLATPPSIAGYGGRGDLRAWLRATALHLVLNITSRESREEVRDECFFAAMVDATPSAEAAYLRRACREEFEASFVAAVAKLTDRERLLLRYAFADGLTVDRIGAVFQVHRATAARWVQKAQSALVEATRAGLAARLGISDDEADSVVRGALSSLGTTLFRHFGQAVEAAENERRA